MSLYRPPPPNHPLLLSAPFFPGASSDASGRTLPSGADLRPLCLAIRNQAQQNSCAAFATVALRELSYAVATRTPLSDYLSPAYLYARTRINIGSFPADVPTSLADQFQTLVTDGVCPEALFPYDQGLGVVPSRAVDQAASAFRINQPFQFDLSVPVANDIRSALANGQAVSIAFPLYQSFGNISKSGVLTLPDAGADPWSGEYHAVLVCGYDDIKRWWIIRNQQGPSWGANGYGFMPYGYESHWTEAWTAPTQA